MFGKLFKRCKYKHDDNLDLEPCMPAPVSPLVNSICNSLATDGDRWELTGRSLEDGSIETFKHECGVCLHFDSKVGYWDICLPRHPPTQTEKEVLAYAVDNWGANRVEHKEEEPEAPGMPDPPEKPEQERGSMFHQ